MDEVSQNRPTERPSQKQSQIMTIDRNTQGQNKRHWNRQWQDSKGRVRQTDQQTLEASYQSELLYVAHEKLSQTCCVIASIFESSAIWAGKPICICRDSTRRRVSGLRPGRRERVLCTPRARCWTFMDETILRHVYFLFRITLNQIPSFEATVLDVEYQVRI